jgi:hypothetical protein
MKTEKRHVGCLTTASNGDKIFKTNNEEEVKPTAESSMQRCISERMNINGETQEQAAELCKRILSDPTFKHVYEEQLNQQKEYDTCLRLESFGKSKEEAREICMQRHLKGDMSKRFNDRVSILQGLHGISKVDAERFVANDFELKGWLPDEREIQPATSVGCLYGKTKQQIIKENSATLDDPRATVGNLYGKSKEEIRKMQGVV